MVDPFLLHTFYLKVVKVIYEKKITEKYFRNLFDRILHCNVFSEIL